MILNKRFFSYILVYFINLSLIFSNQEKGSLSGVVTDEKNGQPLIGANVIISGTSIGSATDLNGRYIIKNLDIGMIDLVVTYIGYKKKIVKGIDISSLKSFEKNIMMDQDVISVMEVKVQAEKRESGDASALQKKQEAIEMQDNISADQISKSGDSHVADAVRRVTGVTIVSDKYLVVRGLGDRYSSAQLNSVGMPSPEADKRSVPLDLFSTALISGIDVAKSYRPDLPGAFGGGNVNIRTKLYPSKTIYKIKFGSGLSSNLTPGSNAFQNFQKNIKGNSDFIGYDFNKSRDIPEFFDNELISYNSIPDEFMPELRDTTYTQFGTQIISSDPMREYLWAEQSYNKNARLKNTFKNSVETSGLPRNLSMTYGTKYQAGRDLEMGFLVDGNFSGKYTYNTERMDRYVAYNDTSSYIDKEDESGEIVRTYDKLLRPGFIGLDRDIYQYATNLGFNFSYGITFRKNLRFGIRNVYTHTSKDNFTKAEGLSGELTYDYKTLYPGIDFDKNIETDNNASARQKKQKGDYFDTYLDLQFNYDKRNQKFKTTDGFRSFYSIGLPVISENNTVKNYYNYKIFSELYEENISTLSLSLSSSHSITGDDIKLSERLYIPQRKLRGFERGKLGPKDGNDFIGGNYVSSINATTTIPTLLENVQSVDVVLFADAANIWGVDYDSSLDKNGIRSSVGIGIDWLTPVGPLTFSFAHPVTKEPTDIEQTFRFNIGTSF